MPADPAVAAALRAAEREKTTAGKIAAFLRAFPADQDLVRFDKATGRFKRIPGAEMHILAAAVTRAAEED